MALVVFLRGINVGGHRRFRPAALAKELRAYDVVNLGAAGTFIVRKPGSRAAFLVELRRRLPLEAGIALCDERDLMRLEKEKPFDSEPPDPGVVRFVSILASRARRSNRALPIQIPEVGEWLVRILGIQNRLVFGIYRRQMKTIGCLGQIDKIFGARATTRNWNTVLAVLRILKSPKPMGVR